MKETKTTQPSHPLPPHFLLPFRPAANPAAVVVLGSLRVTLLTGRLLRLEYSPSGVFEDRPSQAFWFREQPVPPFTVRSVQGGLPGEAQEGGLAGQYTDLVEIETDFLRLRYAVGVPLDAIPSPLEVLVKTTGVAWRCGLRDTGNLKGTYRTLDTVDGHVPLEPGLLSRDGWSVVDDSSSLVFNEHGWLVPRQTQPGTSDLYFFGYGRAYQDCLADFRAVAGPAALVPRWILGNWWSRYWEYSQDDIVRLIAEFQENEVPLSVFIIDMDWHITRTGNASSGWTGYTWNKALFPNPKALIQHIHQQGLRTALNLHPAEGVHPHEAQYPAFARQMGIDPTTQQPIPFDLASPRFANAYFDLLHHPYEKEGVDFWWIDWQQGTLSALPGLDPLWWLNHLHFYDLGRSPEKRPFVFSRWGGLGNHRYPIGFSGDTIVSWQSLAFQPYYTATAANVGYTWWSHDIGGHFGGVEDPELYLRWVQYGLFSPILRLHSTKNPFHERRPFAYDAETSQLARHAMQLRHALIPYLYSMAWRDHHHAEAPIRPLYHLAPDSEPAYHYPQVYTFGSELLAAPFTSPRDPHTRLSRQPIWLPQGDWFDFFSGAHYEPGHHVVYGGLDTIPVFARAGAIVPLAPLPSWGGLENPPHLRLHIFPGADNRFELYEDDGKSAQYAQGRYALTPYTLHWENSSLTFTIEPAQGDGSVCPPVRTYELRFHALQSPSQVVLRLNGVKRQLPKDFYAHDAATHTLTIPVPFELSPKDSLVISIQGQGEQPLMARPGRVLPVCQALVAGFALETGTKAQIYRSLPELIADPTLLARFRPALKDSQLRALLETITRAGVDRTSVTGDDVLLMWNNHASQHLHPVYYQLAVNQLRWPYTFRERDYLEGGALPAFKAYPVQETFLANPWRMEVDYFSTLRLTLKSGDR